ncbi:MAG TPA: tyrosine-type recombinase/integrase [Actinomycetota bacterium]
MQAFPVRLPSGPTYWTVLDDDLRVIADADAYLQQLRFGGDAAESTTESYARALTLYLSWCAKTGQDWASAERLGSFIIWLQHTPNKPNRRVVTGPGVRPVRRERRVNLILTVVREFLRYGVTVGTVSPDVLSNLYKISDDQHLPAVVRGEGGQLRYWAKPRHRLSEPDEPVDKAIAEEVLALLQACRSARDRLIIVCLARAGLRRGELCGLRREDVHLVVDARHLGCTVEREHLHVRRRENPNGALAKSRRARAVPVDSLLVLAFDQYAAERAACRPARDCDFVLVNLFRPPLGQPMRPGALNELLADLSRRAGLERQVHPHMLRHGFASSLMEAGSTLDETQVLLGHASITSTQVYMHPSQERLRAAVERAGVLRAPSGSGGGSVGGGDRR